MRDSPEDRRLRIAKYWLEGDKLSTTERLMEVAQLLYEEHMKENPLPEMRVVEYFITNEIRLVNRDPELRFPDKPGWALVRQGSVYNRDGEWEWEPMPSYRDDEFLARCRFTLQEAENLLSNGHPQ